jgi:hypothetical protein
MKKSTIVLASALGAVLITIVVFVILAGAAL